MSALLDNFATRIAAAGGTLLQSPAGVGLPGSPALVGSSLYQSVVQAGKDRRAVAAGLASGRADRYGRRVDAAPDAVKARGDVHKQAHDMALTLEWADYLGAYFGHRGEKMDASPQAALRADGLVPMASQALTYFYTEVYEIQHGDLPAWQGDLLKIDRSVDPAAQNYVWYEKDIVGVARASNSYSTVDIPVVAGPMAQANTGLIVPALVAMEVNFMEMRNAALARANGKPDFDVDRSKQEACQRALAEFTHFLWLYGDAQLGIDGLHNHPAVSTITLTGGPWSGKSPAQILTDLTTMLYTIPNTSLGQLGDLRKIKMFLPPDQWQQANSVPITAAGDKSVLQYFKEMNGLRDDQVVWNYELKASNSQVYTGGPTFLNADRALVLYLDGRMDMDPVFVLPQDIEMPAPPRQNGLSETTFFHLRAGGMKLPDARRIRYVEGL